MIRIANRSVNAGTDRFCVHEIPIAARCDDCAAHRGDAHVATLALVDAMKARGVRSFKVGDVEAEFGPVETPLSKPDANAAVDNERCRCGCPLHGHVGGMCVTGGCSPEKCAEKRE